MLKGICMKSLQLAIISILFSISNLANAGLIEQLDYYTYFEVGNGLEWVYASPCAGVGGCGSDVNLIDGFRFASDIEWTVSFADLSALIGAFELDNYDASVCAAQYFGSGYSHCDVINVEQGRIWGAPVGIATSESYSQSSYGETFLVRGEIGEIPEPTTVAIFALGLLGLGLRKRNS